MNQNCWANDQPPHAGSLWISGRTLPGSAGPKRPHPGVERSWEKQLGWWEAGQRGARLFFPTCQVRVVRFYQSCSSPPRLALLLLLLFLLLLVLLLLLLRLFRLDHVCINFHLNFRLANSWTSSLPTSQLSVHRCTSTWDLPSSVCTAGPQPGTFRAQCAPLDLNLGPSQLSARRYAR